MSDMITKETFEHLVKLAELELSTQEAEYLRGELNNQLKAIEELKAIPLDEDIPISLHGVPYAAANSPALREDEWKPFENNEGLISQIPDEMDDYIVVPDIPTESLD